MDGHKVQCWLQFVADTVISMYAMITGEVLLSGVFQIIGHDVYSHALFWSVFLSKYAPKCEIERTWEAQRLRLLQLQAFVETGLSLAQNA